MSAYNASALKRFSDVVLALVVLPIALPLVLLAFLVVLIFSGGPALFIQDRVGLHGKVFRIYKVRTSKMALQIQWRVCVTTTQILSYWVD